MTVQWEQTKYEVLQENTAQAIHNELERLDNEREKYERRWIWELFQNASDAAPKDGEVRLNLALSKNFLFSHNGVPFSAKDILHLVFHGSTKREKEDAIGRYGTGFLSTHTISRRVTVRGRLDTGEAFGVEIDRSGGSPQELAVAMESSMLMLQNSLSVLPPTGGDQTAFEYELTDATRSIVGTSLSRLALVAPYVLAFNKKIGALRIEDNSAVRQLLVQRAPVSEGIELVEVSANGDASYRSTIAVVRDDQVMIAMPVSNHAGRLEFLQPAGIPKLFVAFPLVGTENVAIPFVANCPRGKPTEERDGLYLGSESSRDNENNKESIARCWALFSELTTYASSNGWGNLSEVAKLRKSSNQDGLDGLWLDSKSVAFLRDTIIVTPIVETHGGELKPPSSVVFGIVPPAQQTQTFHYLIRSFFGSDIPTVASLPLWMSIVTTWQELDATLTIQSVSLSDLAKRVSSLQTLEQLASRLSGTTSIEWLDVFLDAILRSGDQHLFDNLALLPDQEGCLSTRKELRQDDHLDAGLKEIASELGHPILQRLLDKRIGADTQALLPPYKQDTLLSEILKSVRERANKEAGKQGYQRANARLFSWLAASKMVSDLKSYPLLCANTDGAQKALVEDRERVFAPVQFWPSEAREFADLFPSQNLLSSVYVDYLQGPVVSWLEETGFLKCDPVVVHSRDLSSDDVSALLAKPFTSEEEEREHEIGGVSLVDIACLVSGDLSLMSTVRSSRNRGAKFLRFLLSYVVPRSTNYLSRKLFPCSCGQSHELHQAFWLPSVRERSWVYERKGHSNPPNAQNLARLCQEDPSLGGRLADETVLLVMEHLGISASDLVLNASGAASHEMQKAMVMILNATKSDLQQVQKVAELLVSDPEIIGEFERRQERRERTRQNQLIGRLVEDAFRELFELPEIKQLGLSLSRTGIGSDFAIDHDYVENGTEFGLQVQSGTGKYLVEIKSATGETVAMTHTQAQKAASIPKSFALCVVPIADGPIEIEQVRESARFVVGIGDLVSTQVLRVDQMRELRDIAATNDGRVQVTIESGEIRYRVHRKVWELGLNFQDFLRSLT